MENLDEKTPQEIVEQTNIEQQVEQNSNINNENQNIENTEQVLSTGILPKEEEKMMDEYIQVDSNPNSPLDQESLREEGRDDYSYVSYQYLLEEVDGDIEVVSIGEEQE